MHDIWGGMGKYSCPCPRKSALPRARVLAHATQSTLLKSSGTRVQSTADTAVGRYGELQRN